MLRFPPPAVVLALLAVGCTVDSSGGGRDAGPGGDGDGDGDAGTEPFELTLVGELPMTLASDLAARADLVAVSRWEEGAVALIDVSDPSQPELITDIENIGYNADVDIKGDLLFVAHERLDSGMRIYDISDPAAPALLRVLSDLDHPGLAECHTVWPQPDRDLIYCASSETQQVVILSIGEGGVGTPANPVVVTAVRAPGEEPGFGVHDMYAIGDRLYVAYLDLGFAIYDISDPSAPGLIGSHQYEGQFTHNVWPSEDGNFLFGTDEQTGGHLRVYDISDLEQITQIGEHKSNPLSSVHNVEVVGDRAFISWYTEGLVVLDVSEPAEPVEIGTDDFTGIELGPDNMFPFQGVWGVEPLGDLVFISTMESGLRVYRAR